MANLLDILTGLSNTGAVANAPANTPPVPADMQQPAAPVGSQPPIDITGKGDDWAPKHHRTTLGFIADALLSGLSGSKSTPFADRAKSDNLHEAMQNFTANPMQAIRRLGMIKGQEGEAWKKYNEYTDNQRQSDNLSRQNKVYDLQTDKYVDSMVGGMMYRAAERGDPQTYAKMRQQAITYGNRYGKDYSTIIPEEYDPTNADLLAMGAVPAGKQMQVGAQIRGQDLSHQDRMSGQAVARERNAVLGEQGSERLGIQSENSAESKRHNHQTETQAQTNSQQSPRAARKTIMTKYGPAIVSPDGARAILSHGGENYGYTIINGTMVPTGKIVKKGK